MGEGGPEGALTGDASRGPRRRPATPLGACAAGQPTAYTLYLSRGLYPAGWPLSSILPSALEAGLSDNQSKHFFPKKERKGEIKQIHSW